MEQRIISRPQRTHHGAVRLHHLDALALSTPAGTLLFSVATCERQSQEGGLVVALDPRLPRFP